MQDVDQYSNLSFSYPQLPSDLRSPLAGYAPSPVFAAARAAEAFPGPPPVRLLTPPGGDHGAAPRAYRAHQLPTTPPPSPPSFARDDSADLLDPAPRYTNFTSSWANYLDPGHRLQFQKILGSGAYGVVHLAKDVATGIHYAVKALNKFMPNGLPLDVKQQLFQQTEMRLHYQVSAHPNIVSLLRIMDTREHTYVIMEYCPEGDLFLNITERGRYVGDDVAAKAVFLQILDAVSHCHQRGIYHRDLKPENILVTQGGHQVKLADFGLATTEMYATEFGCGSTFYMSPECQDQSSGKPYYACAPNDIWSLGVILVNLTCGRNPWKSASPKDSTFRAYMEDRQFLKSILPLSDELNEILGMIFEVDPSRRIKLDELRHRILNCQQFTKPPPPPTYVHTMPYVEPLSPSSTVSDEGSMISDHSDDSTVPSEADSNLEDDFSSFEVMEEDCGDFDGPACHGPLPEPSPAPKAHPPVWHADSIISGAGSQDPPLNSYVPALPPNPLAHDVPRTFAEVAQDVPIAPLPDVGLLVQFQQPAIAAPATYHTFTTGYAPISQMRVPAVFTPPEYIPRARWPKRSSPRDRPTLRGVNPWQLRNLVLHHTPRRINFPL